MEYRIGDQIEVEALPPKGCKSRWRGLLPNGKAMHWPGEQRITCVLAEQADEDAKPRKITPEILVEIERERRFFRVNRVGEHPSDEIERARARVAEVEAAAMKLSEERERLEARGAAAEKRAEQARGEAEELRRQLAAANAALEVAGKGKGK